MATSDRDNNFDLVRLFAACQVVTFHSLAWIDLPKPPLWLLNVLYQFNGVAIFFVISGFLISGSLLSPNKSLLTYARARFLRIYPALWVNIIGLLVMLFVARQLLVVPEGPFFKWLLTFLATGSDYLANLWMQATPFVSGGFYPEVPSGVLWTLPIEISFYFLAPVILAGWLRRHRLAGMSLLVWAAVSLFMFATTPTADVGLPDEIMLFLWIFLMGAAARYYWASIRRFFEGKALIWLVVYLAAGYAYYALTGKVVQYWTRDANSIALTILMAGTVLSCAYTAPHLARILKGWDISYGLYLWHMPVIWTLVGFGLKGVLPAVTAWSIAIGLAAASWVFIERPALRLRARANGPKLIEPTRAVQPLS